MTEFGIVRVVAGLIIVVALILICGWLAKRSGFAGSSGHGVPLRLLARQSLGGRSSIVVLQVEKERLVLGITPNSIQTLATLPEAENELPSQAPQAPPVPFAQIFNRIQDSTASRSTKP